MRPTSSSAASIAVGVALATVLVLVIAPPHSVSPAPGGEPPGYTFDQAASRALSQAANTSDGPWRLISAAGVVTNQPLMPEVVTYPAVACQDLTGPTVWNGSGIPVWTGSMAAGIAPFWEFLFVNYSNAILPVQTVNESVVLGPPVPLNTPCGEALYHLDGTNPPSNLPAIVAPFDSSVAGSIAWNYEGRQFTGQQPQVAEYFGLGPTVLSGLPWGPGWGVKYGACGLKGFTGDLPEASAGITSPSGPPSFQTNGTGTCTFTSYTVSFGPASRSSAPESGVFVSLPITVNSPYVNNSLAIESLAAWIIALGLTNATGASQALSTVSCLSGIIGPTSCRATGLGWFAALASDTGYWLDLFDSGATTPTWLHPNVDVLTNDTLVVYLPASIAAESLTLTTNSAISSVHVSGSATV